VRASQASRDPKSVTHRGEDVAQTAPLSPCER